MWFTKKKREALHPLSALAPQEEQKPASYSAVIEMVLINNKTDKEYVLKSQNDFGLKWTYSQGDDKTRNDLLCIQQKENIDGTAWSAIGRYYDFSILSMVHKTFPITGESWYGKVVCLKDDITEEQIKEMYGYENFTLRKAINYTVMEDRGRIIKIQQDWFSKRIFDIKQP